MPNPELPLFGVTLWQLLLVAFVGGMASIFGGVTGYGSGLILPLVLVPTIGAEATIPVIGISAILNNASRLVAFRHLVDWRKAGLLALVAAPGCALGAWLYSLLSGPTAAVVIGGTLMALVPVKRWLKRTGFTLRGPALGVSGFGYGLLAGGTAGSGIVLLSVLMAAGLNGRAVVATDAAISVVMGVVKTIVFQSAGSLTPALWAMALVIGFAAVPGAFTARWLVERMPIRVHDLLIEVMVFLGGAMLVWRGLADLTAAHAS